MSKNLEAAAIAFATCTDKDSVEYARARGAFYAAILEAADNPTPAPPVRYKPRSLREVWGAGGILGGVR